MNHFENINKYIGEFKNAENCFIEIVNKIIDTNINSDINSNSNINSNSDSCIFDDNYSLLNYSKMRNYSEKKYDYRGGIKLNETFYLRYNFTNYKSYISVDINKDLLENKNDIMVYYMPYIQYLTMYFTEKLFKKYTIDEFITNLIS
jgi:hypothetical protein